MEIHTNIRTNLNVQRVSCPLDNLWYLIPPNWNAAANRLWNRDYQKFDVGYTQFTKDGLRTVTHGDVIGVVVY